MNRSSITKGNRRTIVELHQEMDSPLKKQRWGTGICWEYMENGRCNCKNNTKFFGSHPTLKVEATTTTGGGSSSDSSGTVVIMPRRIPDWIFNLEYLNFIEGDLHNFATLQRKYEERHEVKNFGADYSPGMKQWIVAPGKDLQPFAKWHPKIHNRGENEVVFYNTKLGRKSAVDAFLRCGFYAAHIIIVGDDEEAETLRNELKSKIPIVRQGNDSVPPEDDNDVLGGKRTLNFHYGDHAATAPSQSSKRPCFSNPESMQAFVRMSQEKQMGDQNAEEGEGKMMMEEMEGSSSSISSLLTTAKSLMVDCISDGSISPQQKKFNEAMYNVIEAIAAEMGRRDLMKAGSSAAATQHPSVAHVSPARGNIRGNTVAAPK